jgi:hypothetical protein
MNGRRQKTGRVNAGRYSAITLAVVCLAASALWLRPRATRAHDGASEARLLEVGGERARHRVAGG